MNHHGLFDATRNGPNKIWVFCKSCKYDMTTTTFYKVFFLIRPCVRSVSHLVGFDFSPIRLSMLWMTRGPQQQKCVLLDSTDVTAMCTHARIVTLVVQQNRLLATGR